MSLGLPSHLAPSVVARSMSRAARIVACVCLVVAALALVLAERTEHPWAVLVPIAMAVIVAVPVWRVRLLVSAIYGILGVVAVYNYVLALQPGGSAGGAYFLTLLEVGFMLAGAAQRSGRNALTWITVAFVVAEVVRFAALTGSGRAFAPDVVLIGVYAVATVGFIAAGRNRRSARGVRAWLQLASRNDEVSQVRRGMEMQAAAFMHDTVLGHLAAISSAEPGVLTEHARTQISRDIGLLVGRRWLVTETPDIDPALGGWASSPLREEIATVHGPALQVTVTGDLNAIERLTYEEERAVALAVKQALVNVERHAGVAEAEVVLLAAHDAVSIMVIDAGSGFDTSATPSDRLGISQSIRARIEMIGGRVDIWSAPGGGTSVVLSVPVAADDDDPDEVGAAAADEGTDAAMLDPDVRRSVTSSPQSDSSATSAGGTP